MFPPIYTLLQASPEARNIFGAQPRIYRDEAPQDPTYPYGVWQVIGGFPENTLSETPGHDRVSVQLDIYATTQKMAEQAAAAARDQLETNTHVTSFRTDRDGETRSYRVSLDFDYWLARET
jgi:hypothetical protein